jgi:hypothetical protein
MVCSQVVEPPGDVGQLVRNPMAIADPDGMPGKKGSPTQ